MTLFSRTRASALASIFLTLTDPPSATAATSPDAGPGPLLGGAGPAPTSIFGPTRPILTRPRARVSYDRRHHDEIFDRLEL